MALSRGGFTLVELMIVVAIIAILSAVVVPMFGAAVRKSHEAVTKGNLGVMRSTISIYYADAEGAYPTDHLESLIPKYIADFPIKNTPPYHPSGNTVSGGDDLAMTTATGDWFYFNIPSDPKWGTVVVNCIHQDINGRSWSTY